MSAAGKLWLLVRIEFVRSLWFLKRYPFDTVVGFVSFGVIFFLLLGAGQVVAGTAPTKEGISQLILTYILGFLVLEQVSNPSQTISQESRNGMLEHLFMSGHALPVVFVARAVGGLLTTFLTMGVLAVALLLLTGTTLNWSALMLLPTLSMLLSALGLGLMLGGVAILFKKTESVFFFVQLLMFALTSSAAPVAWWQYLLPIAPSAGFVRAIANNATYSLEGLLLTALSALVWLIAGVLVFQFGLRLAQQRGLLGHE